MPKRIIEVEWDGDEKSGLRTILQQVQSLTTRLNVPSARTCNGRVTLVEPELAPIKHDEPILPEELNPVDQASYGK